MREARSAVVGQGPAVRPVSTQRRPAPPPAAAAPLAALSLESAELPADAVEVGRIGEAFGIQGWFKVVAFNAQPEALFSSKRWFLLPPEKGGSAVSQPVRLAVRQAREHADGIVASAQDIPDRTAAEALRGARVFVARSSFPTLPPDEFYWVDLIGMHVVNRQAELLGAVRDLLSSAAQTVLVVADASAPPGPDILIPFVAAYVDTVDTTARRIAVDWQRDY